MFVGVIAIILVIISLMNFNPKVESWSSLLAGGAIGLLIVMSPKIIAYVKDQRKKP